MSAHMRSDIRHLHPVDIIVPAYHMIESVLPMHRYKWHIVFIIEQESAIAINSNKIFCLINFVQANTKNLALIRNSGKHDSSVPVSISNNCFSPFNRFVKIQNCLIKSSDITSGNNSRICILAPAVLYNKQIKHFGTFRRHFNFT